MKPEPLPAAINMQPLATLAGELKSGKLALKSYIDESLKRIEEQDGVVKALLPEEKRRARLYSDAKKLEERWPEPQKRPPLYGVLVGVKDIYAADGFETRAGSKLPPETFRMPEGPLLKTLKEQGAMVLGKTVTTEFAYFTPGPTSNPWNPSRTPGGSSSGSAAGLAAGFFSLALGSQTIGSISRPAAYCGVYGWKPSYERLPRAGVVPFSPSVDTMGLFTSDAAGMALAAAAASPDWNAESYAKALDKFRGKKPVLAVPEGPYLLQADSAAITAFEQGLKVLEDSGFTVLKLAEFGDIDTINNSHRRICAAEMERTHRQWYRDYPTLFSDATRELMQIGALLDDEELVKDLEGRFALRARLESQMKQKGIDFWISPSAAGVAPISLGSTGSPFLNLPWTYSGLPSLAMPSGVFLEGMPLGFQLAGFFGKDEELLALGTIIEDLL